MKKTFKHLHKGEDMTYEECQVLFCKIADALNERPLGVRSHNSAEPSVCPVTPNLLLHGSRTAAAAVLSKELGNLHNDCVQKMAYIEATFDE